MIIKKNKEKILTYLEDSSNLKGEAFAVYIPESVAELKELVEKLVREREEITLSGARTGVVGGAVPLRGVVISLEKLSKVEKIYKDKDKFLVKVEPGVNFLDFCKKIEEEGFWFPSLPTEPTAFIGGSIATCAGGKNTFKYGSIRRWVKGLKILLTTGDVLNLKRGERFFNKRSISINLNKKETALKLPSYQTPQLKCSSGYFVRENMDLIDLFIGQEGTLGIILEAQIQIIKKEKEIFGGLIFFKEENKLFEFVERMRAVSLLTRLNASKEIDALCLEFFDENSLNILKEKFPQIPKGSKAGVYFEQEYYKENFEFLLEKWIEFIQRYDVDLDKVWIAQTQKEKDRLFEFRHALPEAINTLYRRGNIYKLSTDIVVPFDKLFLMYRFYKDRLKDFKGRYFVFGHIGDANLHVNILPQSKEEIESAKRIIEEFYKYSISLGGMISGEHGIGKRRREYLKMRFGEKGIKEMANLKRILDPYCILNLENIFLSSYLKL